MDRLAGSSQPAPPRVGCKPCSVRHNLGTSSVYMYTAALADVVGHRKFTLLVEWHEALAHRQSGQSRMAGQGAALPPDDLERHK